MFSQLALGSLRCRVEKTNNTVLIDFHVAALLTAPKRRMHCRLQKSARDPFSTMTPRGVHPQVGCLRNGRVIEYSNIFLFNAICRIMTFSITFCRNPHFGRVISEFLSSLHSIPPFHTHQALIDIYLPHLPLPTFLQIGCAVWECCSFIRKDKFNGTSYPKG